MSSSRRIVLGAILTLGALAVAIPGVPGQNPNNPKGVDVYAGTGAINWASVKNPGGVSFAFLKATQGTYYQDANYATNRANANGQGIVIGAYHFADPATTQGGAAANAIAQANYFINFAKPAKGDFQVVCDWEVNYNNMSAAAMGTWLTAFCGQIQTLTHTPAIIYTYPSFWSNMPSNWTNPNCALWIANYGVSSPSLPPPWASSGYAFWQYSSTSSVSGISGKCDVDTFNGSATALLKFTYPRDPMAARR